MFMGVSPGKQKSNTAKPAWGQSAFVRILHRKILYRGSLLVVMLVCVGCLAAVSAAQEERPQITPGERKVPRKKEAGPRALAVLQLAANGKATLVPITILTNGKFYDATAYKADPVPMALESGTVYEAERTGSSFGLFTVNSALHSNAANVQSPWIGTGKWLPAGADEGTKTLKAEAVPVGIDTSDEPPRLTKNPDAVKRETAPASTTQPSTPASTTPSDDGPPRLTKSAPQGTPPESTAPGSSGNGPSGTASSGSTQSGSSSTTPGQPAGTAPATPGQSKPGDATPSDAKPGDAKPADHAKAPESDSGANEANRPRLRRGKPVDPLPEDEVPGYSKPGAAASPALPANAAKVVEAAATKGPIQLIPAISDASGPEPHSYTFTWLKEEEGERRAQMLALSKEQLRAYLDAQTKARITPKPSGPQAARRIPAKKAAEPIFENVQMVAYDLWTNNQPVILLAADAHMPAPAAGSPQSADSQLQYSIMLVARTDIYNNLHKLYVGITDKYHLDITPRLELIDAVDADGDGRGELLFRETSDQGTGWLIYRATADKLWKMFDSLNPE